MRNATLQDLATALVDEHARKHDIVLPARALTALDGHLIVTGSEVELTEDGVTTVDGTYLPTVVCDEGIAAKLDIPLAYVRRMRATRPDLWDANVNGWLREDDRKFLLRTFKADGQIGVARALLSDSYKVVDNLDALTAALAGVRDSGADVEVTGCDITDRRMEVRVKSTTVSALAPELLRGYRSPFTGESGDANPVVWGGFVISNSETGGGAFSITPRLIVQVCSNGMKITKDAMRAVHLGGRLDEGIIKWSAETQNQAVALVSGKARDAVATFLDRDYITQAIAALTESAGAPLTDPAEAVKVVGKKLAYTDETVRGVLNHFIAGGALTAGGVMHAVTSYAQTVDDADAASDLEGTAIRAMEVAAAI